VLNILADTDAIAIANALPDTYPHADTNTDSDTDTHAKPYFLVSQLHNAGNLGQTQLLQVFAWCHIDDLGRGNCCPCPGLC